jgi:alpha-1,2-mannosyltransferase
VSANSTSIAGPADRVRAGSAARAAVAVAVLLFAWTMVDAGWRGEGHDLLPTVVAGRLVATDRVSHLYAHDVAYYNQVNDPEFRRATAELGSSYESTPFVYPPLVAYATQFGSAMPFDSMMLLWTLLSTLFLLIGLYCTLRVYAPTAKPAWVAVLFLALCAYEPLLYGLWLGQTTSLVFALTMGGIALQREQRWRAAGCCVALAAFVKLTPIVIALVWLWRGPRRAAAYCGATLVGLWGVSIALMGTAVTVEYLQRVNAIRRVVLVAYNNHSLLGFLSRFDAAPLERLQWRMLLPTSAASAAQIAVLAALAAVAIVALLRLPARADDQRRMFLEGMALLAMLLVPNIAWTHYFVFLIPVGAIALAMRRPGDASSLILAAVAIALCCRPLLPRQDLAASTLHNLVLMSLPTIAAVTMFCALVSATRRVRRPDAVSR